MPKRKKTVVKRTRRSPYERSLEHATKRLDQALEEQLACQIKLQGLEQEIPYLQGIIRALKPTVEERPPERILHTNLRVTSIPIEGDQEGFLSRFVKPVPLTKPISQQGVVTDQSEPFIPDIVPGEEVLP
jgi:hypothetical protein